MDIDARIRRRWRQGHQPQLIQDYEALSPVAHIDEPAGRGLVIERLLDHLEPVFDGKLPPDVYVYGPPGAGKSAIVAALFAHLEQFSPKAQSVIHTSTRVTSPTAVRFLYLDRRQVTSTFEFYHRLLDGLLEETVPEQGISTAELRSRLQDVIAGTRRGIVLAIDHVDNRNEADTIALQEVLDGPLAPVSWLAVGRSAPAKQPLSAEATLEIDAYQRQTLVDVLMTRASKGLTQQALDHELAHSIAIQTGGNAHHALTVLFVAADRAHRAGRTRVTEADITAAVADLPEPAVSLARVLALPANKQAVLQALIELDATECPTVTATTDRISASDVVDLSPETVRRFLYEMAEIGIVERVRAENHDGPGRPPSRLELRFAPTAFRRLSETV